MLSVKNLSISFKSNKLQNTVVHDISFELKQQQIIGIVGESGSGKSVTSLAILGLLSKNAKIKGDIIFNDINLKSLSEQQMVWEQSVMLEGSPFVIRMNFSKL